MAVFYLGAFFLLLLLSVPIYLTLGITAAGLFYSTGQPLVTLAQKIVDELNSSLLVAVPFFVIAATFMQRGGTAQALVNLSAAWVGSLRGGLGLVTVAGCTLFAAISGSSVATALAMGTILIPAMLRRGYPKPFALGTTAASGTLGILVPPSTPLILYAILSDAPVPRLFLAGVIPAVLLAAFFMIWIIIYGRATGLPAEPPMSRKEFVRVNLKAIPALSVPTLIAIGIYGGYTTATEASAVAAVTSLIVAVVWYRGFRLRDTFKLIGESLRIAGAITMIIAMAIALGHWITEAGYAAQMVDMINEMGITRGMFLVFACLLLLTLGMFLEVASVMLITLPLLIPLLEPLGIDIVHFAIVTVICMELGLITAPVGLNLFVTASVAKEPVTTVIRGVIPYLIIMALILILIVAIPEISTWLPNFVYGSPR